MFRFSTASVVTAVALSALSAGCTKSSVNAFKVDPPTACAGSKATVSWDVTGRAEVTATPAPPGWTDGPVKSVDSREVTASANTTFTVTAPDANPASGNWQKTQSLTVVEGTKTKAASASCSPASGPASFVGTFSLEGYPGDIQIARISNPLAVRKGVSAPRKVCISNGTRSACVEPNQAVDFAAPAAGPWTLSTERAAEEECAPPPFQLRVDIQFRCQ